MQSYSSYIPIDLHTVPQDKKMSFDVFHKTLDGRMEVYCTTQKNALGMKYLKESEILIIPAFTLE